MQKLSGGVLASSLLALVGSSVLGFVDLFRVFDAKDHQTRHLVPITRR